MTRYARESLVIGAAFVLAVAAFNFLGAAGAIAHTMCFVVFFGILFIFD